MGAKDKTLAGLGVEMLKAQERRNLLLELDKILLMTNSVRGLDDRLSVELRCLSLDEMGLSVSRTAMMAKITDAKREVKIKTRDYNNQKRLQYREFGRIEARKSER